ncbi:MAG TPA: 6-carboxytetrahydropterin synthase [Thermoanaerobaculia bacterium]|jgi:6-pyruvoyltetrahydropterin/6-carboxytetrahydropterin synthase|nr:6-carboxytetrahydropterin synthase [Thermoanaerobaculia bacterium]
MPRYRIVLAKEDFKFSAAHFTLFANGGAELLHGHNYRVSVELAGSDLDGEGLLLDIESFKRELRRLCAGLDSRTLIPGESRRLRWSRDGEAIDVWCGERAYRFPAADALLLPLANTSIELLARMLWGDLAPHLAGSRVEVLAVSVEESAGQRCWYEESLGS